MLLDHLHVVLVHTQFPENIGMAARACANMGCPNLDIVAPKRWNLERSRPLATPKGLPLLAQATLFPTLQDAIANAHYVVGTTARTGGWRKNILRPWEVTESIIDLLSSSHHVSLVFGPEDRGLENTETALCHDLVTIPTDAASSLNLAQAVLILLYECAKRAHDHHYPPPQKTLSQQSISHKELTSFLDRFKSMLLAVDCLHGDNIDYFFLPWQRLFARARLTKKEYDALMGLCRQIHNAITPKDQKH